MLQKQHARFLSFNHQIRPIPDFLRQFLLIRIGAPYSLPNPMIQNPNNNQQTQACVDFAEGNSLVFTHVSAELHRTVTRLVPPGVQV